MKVTKRVIFILLISIATMLLPVHKSSGQQRDKPKIGYGASIAYNFMAEGFGAGLRARIPVVNYLYVVPEIDYFPSFNDYHEGYLGAALQYDLFSMGSFNFYLLGAAYYNNWLNAEDYAPGQKKEHNFAPEAGAGLVRNFGCIRPFIENRYDFKWEENHLHIGIYWYPGGCGSGGGREKCPGID